MAIAPHRDETIAAQDDSITRIVNKRSEQEAEGKGFIVPEDGHGPGVIPEDQWKAHKDE